MAWRIKGNVRKNVRDESWFSQEIEGVEEPTQLEACN